MQVLEIAMAVAAGENQTYSQFVNNTKELAEKNFEETLLEDDNNTLTTTTTTTAVINIENVNNYFNNYTNNATVMSKTLEKTSTSTTTTYTSIIETTLGTVQQYLDNLEITTLMGEVESNVTSTTETIPFSTTPFTTTTELWMNTMINYTSSSKERDGSDEIQMLGTAEAVLTIIPLLLITLTIIFGNLLVVIAVFSRKSLRSPQNIYIVSLALTDMGVAVFVLPYNITTLVLQKWIFGETICKLYLTVDVSLCCVSIFHLCAIGVDRFRAITDGINYVQKRNLKSVLWTIFVLWIIAIWIGSPPFLAVQDWKVKYTDVSCEMPDSPGYNFHLAIGALFFPLLIMTVIYGKIYYAIKERFRERARVTCMELTVSDADTTDKLDTEDDTSTTTTLNGTIGKGNGRRKPSAQISAFLVNRQKFSLSKEKKAAKTLGIIMAAFIFCWLPLGFLNVIGSLCPKHLKPSDTIFHVFTWLGYINSALNPIIYGVSNKDFQKAFKRILHLDY